MTKGISDSDMSVDANPSHLLNAMVKFISLSEQVSETYYIRK
jgi:hypothetical protein